VGKGEILSIIERVYSRRRYVGKQGKFKKHKRVGKRV